MSGSTGFGSNVKNMTNDRKSRLMLIGAGAVVIGGLVFAFSSRNASRTVSTLPAPPTLSSAQGGVALTPAYESAIVKGNQQMIDDARANNPGDGLTSRAGSALPTPVFRNSNALTPSLFGNREENGLNEPPVPELRVVSEPPTVPQAAPYVQQTGQPMQAGQAGPPPMDMAMYAAMQAQIKAMLGRQIAASETRTLYVTPTAASGRTGGDAQGGQTAQVAQVGQVAQGAGMGVAARTGMGVAAPYQGGRQVPSYGRQTVERASRIVSPAPGTILAAKLLGRINSDTEGPVVAEIRQGPLTGARLLGSFQFSEAGVVIQFKTMTVKFVEDGLERTDVVSISAVAVDGENLGTSMSTDINRRIPERLAFSFATAFIQGLGQAVTQAGAQTTVLPSGAVSLGLPRLSLRDKLLSAGGAAAGAGGQVMEQSFGNRRTTITVEKDTSFGLLFLGGGNQ